MSCICGGNALFSLRSGLRWRPCSLRSWASRFLSLRTRTCWGSGREAFNSFVSWSGIQRFNAWPWRSLRSPITERGWNVHPFPCGTIVCRLSSRWSVCLVISITLRCCLRRSGDQSINCYVPARLVHCFLLAGGPWAGLIEWILGHFLLSSAGFSPIVCSCARC